MFAGAAAAAAAAAAVAAVAAVAAYDAADDHMDVPADVEGVTDPPYASPLFIAPSTPDVGPATPTNHPVETIDTLFEVEEFFSTLLE